MKREEAIELLTNMTAWAESEGFDPERDYTAHFDLPPGHLSENFHKGEFACNCCGRIHADGVPDALVDALEAIRARFDGKPVNVNSGYRCPAHNQAVGGATQSRHMEGDAADLWIEGVDPSEVYKVADEIIGDSGGVGRYNTFTHIDVRGHMARW